MQAFSLYEGSYSVDSSKDFKPFDPRVDDKKSRPGSLFIHVHPFLVQTTQDLILLDTGLGFQQQGELVLHRNIRAAGFDPKAVNYVLLSHLHKDHASGMVYAQDGSWHLSFPNAEYIVQRNEWEKAFTAESPSYDTPVFEVIQRSSNLRLVDGDGQINNSIRYEVSGGHSEFHQVFHILDGDDHYFFGGDEWPEPEQVLRKFAAKYDYDGRKAMQLRQTYAEQAAREAWTCLFYHAKHNAIAKIEAYQDTFKIISV